MKTVRITVRIIQLALVMLFIVLTYFLLPYILPLVGVKSFVVVSNSMKHSEESQVLFESFWRDMGIEPENLPFRYGFQKGDMLILGPSEEYSLGDVVILNLPGSFTKNSHRIFELNSTHFRDIGDARITEEGLETVTLAIRGISVIQVEDIEKLAIEPDIIYEGQGFEISGHYWMPLSYIEGEVLAALPQAGMIHILFRPQRAD